jgi:hypothetical protein
MATLYFKEGDPWRWYVAPMVTEGYQNQKEVVLQFQPAREQKDWQVPVEQIEA